MGQRMGTLGSQLPRSLAGEAQGRRGRNPRRASAAPKGPADHHHQDAGEEPH